LFKESVSNKSEKNLVEANQTLNKTPSDLRDWCGDLPQPVSFIRAQGEEKPCRHQRRGLKIRKIRDTVQHFISVSESGLKQEFFILDPPNLYNNFQNRLQNPA
jgi:hypothetical protein